MTCEQIRLELGACVSGSQSPARKAEIAAHLGQCPQCAAEAAEVAATLQALGSWEDQPLPAELALSITGEARTAVAAPPDARASAATRPHWKQFSPLLSPLGLGLAAALVSTIIIESRSNFALIHPIGLVSAGALWVVLYGFVFSLFSLGHKSGNASWKFLAQAVLVAGGMFLLLTYISPVPRSVTFCSQYHLTQPLIERLSIGGTFFLFGSLYALLPMGIASFLAAGHQGRHPLLHGSLAGGMFVILLAPSIFMQCAPFALGVLLGWFGGALLGSVIGGALGYWLRAKLV